MKILQKIKHVFILAVTICFIFSISPSLSAQALEPGYHEFNTMDGDGTQCRIKDAIMPLCGVPGLEWLPDVLGVNPWVATFPVAGPYLPLDGLPLSTIDTAANTSTKLIGAAFSNYGFNVAGYVQLGIPFYASSWLYKDIEIDDLTENGEMVDVQISPTYSWEGGLVGSFNYEARFGLGIEVEDITTPSTPVGIGSFDLVSRDRSGDQGVTDGASGSSSYDRNSDTANFLIKLQRGNTYRVYFKAEAFGAPFLISGIESSIRARLETLAISIPNDPNELLHLHDADIKQAIANLSSKVDTHDLAIKQDINELSTQVTIHDDDIKARLIIIQKDLAVIKNLLITPQGRRDDFPLK